MLSSQQPPLPDNTLAAAHSSQVTSQRKSQDLIQGLLVDPLFVKKQELQMDNKSYDAGGCDSFVDVNVVLARAARMTRRMLITRRMRKRKLDN